MLVSGVEQIDSVINTHISISFRFFSLLNYYKILSIIPCAMGRTSRGGKTQLIMHACHSHLISPGRSGHYDCLPINIGHRVTLRIFCTAMFSSCMMWKLRSEKTRLESIFPSFLYSWAPLCLFHNILLFWIVEEETCVAGCKVSNMSEGERERGTSLH